MSTIQVLHESSAKLNIFQVTHKYNMFEFDTVVDLVVKDCDAKL